LEKGAGFNKNKLKLVGMVKEINPKIIVVLGPTASGKTKLAVRLARKFNGEIISADSRQVYKGMDIGTGKDLDDYVVKSQISNLKSQINYKFQYPNPKMVQIPYHLIDIVSPKRQFTVAKWQKLAYQKIEEILKRKKLPIVCGGTGLYISALIEGYNFPPEAEKNQKSKIKNQNLRIRLNQLTLGKLLAQLKQIDLKTYQVIDKKNRRRVQRALEIYYQTGRPKSAQLKKQKPSYNFLLLGLTYPYPILKKRIAKRLAERLKQGLINEVKRWHKQDLSWQRLDDFGLEYRWVAKYLKGEIRYQTMVEQLKKEIFHFAKRQMTWFQHQLAAEIKWIESSNQAIKTVVKFLKK